MTGQFIVGQGGQYWTNPASSSITVTTDNTSYTMGDSIVVSGTVNTVDSINPQRPVIIQTYDGNDQFLRADKVIPAYNGQYSVTIHPNQLGGKILELIQSKFNMILPLYLKQHFILILE